jgi:hypothetical protein
MTDDDEQISTASDGHSGGDDNDEEVMVIGAPRCPCGSIVAQTGEAGLSLVKHAYVGGERRAPGARQAPMQFLQGVVFCQHECLWLEEAPQQAARHHQQQHGIVREGLHHGAIVLSTGVC